jgi:hypothetical protein
MKTCILIFVCCGLMLVEARAEGQRTEVVRAVDLDILVSTVLGPDVLPLRKRAQRRGLRATLVREESAVGAIEVGVFKNRGAAMAALEGHQKVSSVSRNKDVSDVIGDASVRWKKRIVFVRDNVAVALSLDAATVLPAAQSIDTILMNGGAAVQRGSQVSVPRFRVEYSRTKGRDHSIDSEIEFISASVTNGYWSMVDSTGLVCPSLIIKTQKTLARPGILRLEIRGRAMSGARRKPLSLCLVTPGCVVVTKEIETHLVPWGRSR